MTEDKNIFFNIDSRLLFQLGEKLVTNRAVALAELIKNAYDADATEVDVSLENISKPGGTIIVSDNGTGMTLSTFSKTWMRIATIDKEENPFSSKYERARAGEKGIGRFACRRLSKRLILESVSLNDRGSKERLKADFDWASFYPGSDVNEIPISCSADDVSLDIPTGTKLILDNTIESWNYSDVRQLRNEITDLISPGTYISNKELKDTPEEYDPGFSVNFISPEFPTQEQTLEQSFLDNAWAKLTADIDEKGKATFQINVIKKILNKIDKTYHRDDEYKYLKNIKLEIYIFSYRADLFRNSDWKLGQARKVGEERGGIKIYADNFRVFGYGSKGDDWLRLDYDRARSLVGLDDEVMRYGEDDRPGLRLFRNHHLFGHVEFPRKQNPSLEITVNREKLLDNNASDELRKFVRLGVDFATVIYASEIAKENKIKEEKERAREEAKRKAEEEARKRNEEERRIAEDKARKAEKERLIAEQELRRAEQERNEAEKKLRKYEEERRKAEAERRKAEEEARATKGKSAQDKAAEALKREKLRLEAEKEARREEEKKREEEKEAKKKAEEEWKKYKEEQQAAEKAQQKSREELRRSEEEELKRKEEKIAREFSQLRVLAATGTLILIFAHELRAIIDDMEDMISEYLSIIKKLPDNQQASHRDIVESFSNRTDMVKELGYFLGLTMGSESRLEKKQWVLLPVIKSVFKPFKWYFEEFGIEFNIDEVPDNLRTPKMYRSELVSILHNLVSNATKAVKGGEDRRIAVKAFQDNEKIHLWFLDSGKGLEAENREIVFEPFETFSEPDLKFGAGTGLGLKIVRDIIKSYGGDIKFIDVPHPWQTCVEIVYPMEN